MKRIIWFVRHGNRQDFVDPGWRAKAEHPEDPPLSTDGQQQARELARRLKNEKIDHLFSSPFLRTLQTATPVAEALNLSIKVEYGMGEGLLDSWLPAVPNILTPQERSQIFHRVDSDYQSKLIPVYPETEETSLARSGETVRKILTEYQEGNLLLVGHGISVVGGIRGIVEVAQPLTTPLCGLFKIIQQENRWELAIPEDVSHLTNPEAAYFSTYTR